MKLKTFASAFILLGAAVVAFSFKPAKRVTIEWFTLNSGIQSSGVYATLSQAETKTNYTYFGASAPSVTSGNYLSAVAADASKSGEVDNNGTPDDPTDDLPNVNSNTTDVQAAIVAAKNTDGTWANITSGHGSAQVQDKSTF